MKDFDPATVTVSPGHYIGGRIVRNSEKRLAVSRPSDGKTYSDIPVAEAGEVDLAVCNAAASRKESGWSDRPPRDRARAMFRWADLMAEHSTELARLEAIGSTRPIIQAVRVDVGNSIEAIRFFAEYADKLGGEVAATGSDRLGMIVSEPFGVIGAIVPWNFPISMAVWKIGPALAAGNSIVLKPSELTPFSVVMLAELAIEAGIPSGVFNVVLGDGKTTGQALCSHPGIGKISFTGSTATGASIMQTVAMNGVRPLTLELGGKSPQLVFSDAPDLDRVADHIANSVLANAGQACVTGSRLVAEQSIHDELVEKVQERMARIAPGPTWLADTDFPPIISEKQARRIDSIIDASVRCGAEILIGGNRLEQQAGGAFYEPTIMTNVDEKSPAFREEIFGPVLTVQSFQGEDEGIELADHPVFGLAAGVHTSDLGRAHRAVRQIQSGTVWVNRYGRSADFVLPTGGYKSSGFGKDLGRQAVEACQRHKSVLMDIS